MLPFVPPAAYEALSAVTVPSRDDLVSYASAVGSSLASFGPEAIQSGVDAYHMYAGTPLQRASATARFGDRARNLYAALRGGVGTEGGAAASFRNSRARRLQRYAVFRSVNRGSYRARYRRRFVGRRRRIRRFARLRYRK